MQRSLLRWCSKIDLDGTPSRYFPRFRPRRLVMPVNTDDLYSGKRQPNPLFMKVREQQRRRRRAERRGVLQLATVPRERSVGDLYRLLLDACAAHSWFDDAALTPLAVRDLEAAVAAYTAAEAARRGAAPPHAAAAPSPSDSPLYAHAFEAALPPPTPSTSSTTLTVREVDEMWSMLDHTPLNAPVHGALALRGDALVRTVLLELTYAAYPRLRAKQVQQLLHETTGLLPCGRIAVRTGLAEHCGVEGDVAMWRELNVLSERLRLARKGAAAHLQRVEKGVAAQRRWYWRGVLRSAAGRLKLFPVHKEDLQPRLEWVRSSLFAFVAFVEMAEAAGDAQARVRPLIHHLFASQLTRHARRRRVVAAAEAIASTAAAGGAPQSAEMVELAERVCAELRRVKARTADEEEVMEGRTHPMNTRGDRRREQFESSGGAHSTQSLHDESLDRHAADFSDVAPPLLLHALEAASPNALKEAHLVLRYGPQIAAPLRHAPIDVDQSVRRVVEVAETNSYASLHHAQQFRQVEYTACRLYAGRHCLGEGKGETLMSAMQDASMQMLLRYYLASPASTPSALESSAQAQADSATPAEDGDVGPIPAARVRPATTEEEIVL